MKRAAASDKEEEQPAKKRHKTVVEDLTTGSGSDAEADDEVIAAAQRTVDEAQKKLEPTDRLLDAAEAKLMALAKDFRIECEKRRAETEKLKNEYEAKDAAIVKTQGEYMAMQVPLQKQLGDASLALVTLQRRRRRADRLWRTFAAFLHDGVVHDGLEHNGRLEHLHPYGNRISLLIMDLGCSGCYSSTIASKELVVTRRPAKGLCDVYQVFEFDAGARCPYDYLLSTLQDGPLIVAPGHRIIFCGLCGACIDRVKADVAARIQRIQTLTGAILDAIGGIKVIANLAATYFFAPSRPRCLHC